MCSAGRKIKWNILHICCTFFFLYLDLKTLHSFLNFQGQIQHEMSSREGICRVCLSGNYQRLALHFYLPSFYSLTGINRMLDASLSPVKMILITLPGKHKRGLRIRSVQAFSFRDYLCNKFCWLIPCSVFWSHLWHKEKSTQQNPKPPAFCRAFPKQHVRSWLTSSLPRTQETH